MQRPGPGGCSPSTRPGCARRETGVGPAQVTLQSEESALDRPNTGLNSGIRCAFSTFRSHACMRCPLNGAFPRSNRPVQGPETGVSGQNAALKQGLSVVRPLCAPVTKCRRYAAGRSFHCSSLIALWACSTADSNIALAPASEFAIVIRPNCWRPRTLGRLSSLRSPSHGSPRS